MPRLSQDKPISILHFVLSKDVSACEAVELLQNDDYFAQWLIYTSIISETSSDFSDISENDVLAITNANQQDLEILQETLRERFPWITIIKYFLTTGQSLDDQPPYKSVYEAQRYHAFTLRKIYAVLYGHQLPTQLDNVVFEPSDAGLVRGFGIRVGIKHHFLVTPSSESDYFSLGKMLDNITLRDFRRVRNTGPKRFEKFMKYLNERYGQI